MHNRFLTGLGLVRSVLRYPEKMRARVAVSLAAGLFVLAAEPPKTRRDDVKEVLHGVEVADPYRWLEDQESPETRAWIEEQNKFTRPILEGLAGRGKLQARLAELMKTDTVAPPSQRHGRLYFRRRAAGAEQHLIKLRLPDGKEEVLVDPASIDKNPNTSVSVSAISDDGKWLAYAIQKGGKDEHRVRVLDVDTRQHLADELPEGRWGSVSFTRDKKRIYYSAFGGPNPRIRLHTMGTPFSADKDVFGEGYGEKHILVSEISHDGRWLLITVYHGSSGDHTELHAKDLSAPDAPTRDLTKGVKAAFHAEIVDGRVLAQTNHKAPNWRVISIDLANPGEKNWKEVVPEAKHVMDSIVFAGGRIVAGYLNNVRSELKIFTPDGKLEREVPLPAAGSVSRLSGRWEDESFFYDFTTLHIPPQIYRFNLKKGSQDIWHRADVPIRTGDFDVRQEWFASKDGTKVPMFLLHRKGIARDGNAPTVITGYGGFNLSTTPLFSAQALTWVEQGGIWAVVNLRGGGEFGEQWHKAGMLGNKQNVFDDFTGAAEYLIREKYTRPEKLAIRGGSNGGLLVGAAMTQRPELYRAVLCEVPLLDMIRYHKFLVAKFWVPEYGSSEDPKQFPYLLKYSPYHNVKPGTKYPAVLFVTGDSDTRVAPLHARKMAALLQSSSTGGPVLLHYDTQAGHSQGMSVSRTINDTADKLAFLAWQLDVKLD